MGDDVLDRHLLLFAHGFALNLALVASIGAQSVLIIRQGLLGDHLSPVVTTCFLVDILVITLGSVSFGAVLGAEERFASAAAWAGLSFLLVYPMQRLRSALQPGSIARATYPGS